MKALPMRLSSENKHQSKTGYIKLSYIAISPYNSVYDVSEIAYFNSSLFAEKVEEAGFSFVPQ